MKTRLSIFLVFVALSVTAAPVTDKAADTPTPDEMRRELCAGLSAIQSAGYPAPVVALAPQAACFGVGTTSEGATAAIAGLTSYGKGRLAVFGHPAYLFRDNTQFDTDELLKRTLHWLANGRKPEIGVVANAGVAKAVRALGFTVREVDSIKDGKGIPVLVFTSVPGDETDAALAHIKNGGGILLADLPWAWKQYRNNNGLRPCLALDYAVNKVLAPCGLLLCDGGVTAPPNGFDLTKPLPDAAYLRTALKLVAKGKFKDDAERLQAAKMITLCADVVPPETKGYPEAFRRLSEHKLARKSPTPAHPLGPADTLARLAVITRKNAWQAKPSEPCEADPAAAVYPGLVKSNAKPTKTKLTLTLTHTRWQSTGWFLPAGGTATVTVPASAAKKGYYVRVGTTADDLTNAKSAWERAPLVTVQLPLDAPTVRIASPFGGLVYLGVPDGALTGKAAARPPVLQLVLDGCVEAPHFRLGETKGSEWKQAVATCAAPQVELEGQNVIFTVPLDAARKVKNPEALMTFWDKVLDLDYEFLGVTTPRPYKERVCFDVQISAGYLHSGYPVMAPPDANLIRAVTDLEQIKREGAWGFYHEFGHNHQRAEWTFDGFAEVSVNFFSLYCSEKMNGLSPRNALKPWTTKGYAKANGNDPFAKLDLFITLQEAYGTDILKRLVQTYTHQDAAVLPKTDLEKRDQMALRLSELCNANIAEVFEHWGIGVSSDARTRCARHPKAKPDLLR